MSLRNMTAAFRIKGVTVHDVSPPPVTRETMCS